MDDDVLLQFVYALCICAVYVPRESLADTCLLACVFCCKHELTKFRCEKLPATAMHVPYRKFPNVSLLNQATCVHFERRHDSEQATAGQLLKGTQQKMKYVYFFAKRAQYKRNFGMQMAHINNINSAQLLPRNDVM
jgi:hypothetical protein